MGDIFMASASAGPAIPSESRQPLSSEELRKMHAYWRAANYVSVGQIYLLKNPLLREPLKLEDIKPRLLGHWGTTPGLNFIYVHFNRLIKKHDLNVIYVAGPGHGGPALVGNAFLEGTYSEFYTHISQTEDGMRKLFKQSHSRAAFRAMSLPRRQARFMRAANWAIRLRTPTAPHLITRTSWFAAWSAMARRKQGRW